jgi:DNA methyltransferase 1-associated protein 1
MPTRDNVAQLEALIEATTHLVETKRLVDKIEYDISVLKKRMELHEDEDGNGDAIGSAMEIEDSQTGVDAEGETEDETGGAESVVSARSTSGRASRKQVRKFS